MPIQNMLIIVLLAIPLVLKSRSHFRKEDPLLPQITTYWADDPSMTHTLKNSHLEKYATFDTFHKEYFFSHLIPSEEISFRNDPTGKISGALLKKRIDEVLDELHQSRYQKTSFTHFIVLKNRDYNPRTHAGLIILKFKEYPFVVKIFMETPETLVRPFSKGIEPSFIFTLGRGSSRHGLGFTRLPNLENLNKKIHSDPEWATLVDVPRKWYFYSPHCRWIVIQGTNIGIKGTISCTVPGTYGIICDAIEEHPTQKMSHGKNRKKAIALAHYLDCTIDPHINNFMIEKSTGKIVIIDTEHFPSLVGLDKPFTFSNYASYYAQLTKKYLRDALFRTKKERHDAQHKDASVYRRITIQPEHLISLRQHDAMPTR